MKRETQKTRSSNGIQTGAAGTSPCEGAMRGVARRSPEIPKFNDQLMEEILDKDNLRAAFKAVKRNKGAAGCDGMRVEELENFLRNHVAELKASLLQGSYIPDPVLRVDIPKPGGGVRQLGIPTVKDRFIQQAICRVLQKGFDPHFSEFSFGFRPKRSAHDAISAAKCFQTEGFTTVVDIDLAKFFDEVNHDRLMSRLAKSIQDKRVLKLIRAYLRSGVMNDGLTSIPSKGTPQGGPLSPLLSNIVLDELDKELESRGHRFVRFADDCQIYVKSERAGMRVMKSVSGFIEDKLRLKVNQDKSMVCKYFQSSFLGFSFILRKGLSQSKLSSKSLTRFKNKIRELTSPRKRVSFDVFIRSLRSFILGWKGYFGRTDCKGVFRDLDTWIRRRIRCFIWQQWRKFRTKVNKLKRFGVNHDLAMTTAASGKGAWRVSASPGLNIAFPNSYFDRIGLPRLYNKLLT